MFSPKLLLVVSVGLGAVYCPPYLILLDSSHLSQLTALRTKTSEYLQTYRLTTTDVHGQGKQNGSRASFPQNLSEYAVIGEANASCDDDQSQSGRYFYLQASVPNSSIIIPRNITTDAVYSRAEPSMIETIRTVIKTSTVYLLSYIVAVTSSSPISTLVLSFIWLYFTGSLFFDMAHHCLHKFSKSPYRILRRIGYLHEVHHLYFNRRLKFNDRYLWQNMLCELPLELSCQLFGTWLGYLVAKAFSLTGPGLLSQELFHLVLIFEAIRSFVVAILEGRDSNHQSYTNVVPKDPHTFLVGPEYHALHHVNPSAYISSSFRIFDWFLGTSYTLRSRRVTMAGLTGHFGRAMKRELQLKESTNCIHELSSYEDNEKIVEVLSRTDVLIIGPEDSCNSVVMMIELFKAHYKPRPGCLLLPEVWYFRSPDHSSTSAESVFTSHARKYYDSEDIIYRHIILSSSTSKFGTSILGPDFAAKAALWWIRRGARYVPLTTPGVGILGYFKLFQNL
ncbi:hypothetical protein N431DRAFT_447800 [Stipitochalara longipes BDJ]|nr:hypothetical protein N431DRAFT_447800 [Stipitochalara longipes BDJ]